MYIRLINREITASRWPWQKGYNWHGMTNSTAPLNQPLPGEKAAPRFGGGWKYSLGIDVGGSTILLSLLFGMIIITKVRKCEGCGKPMLKGQKTGPWREDGYKQHFECWESRHPEARDYKPVHPATPITHDDGVPF